MLWSNLYPCTSTPQICNSTKKRKLYVGVIIWCSILFKDMCVIYQLNGSVHWNQLEMPCWDHAPAEIQKAHKAAKYCSWAVGSCICSIWVLYLHISMMKWNHKIKKKHKSEYWDLPVNCVHILYELIYVRIFRSLVSPEKTPYMIIYVLQSTTANMSSNWLVYNWCKSTMNHNVKNIKTTIWPITIFTCSYSP